MGFFDELEKTLTPLPPDSEEEGDGVIDSAMDQAFDDYEEEENQLQQRADEEFRVLSEVEARLYKANLYRAVLENPLFPSEGGDIAAQVEKEYREFTMRRLNDLLGIPNEEGAEALEANEVKVLKLWARKLLGKPGVVAAPAAAPEARAAPVMAPVTVAAPVTVVREPQPARVPVARPQAPRQRAATPAARPQQQQAPVKKKRAEFIDEDGFIHKGGKKYMRQQGKDAFTGEAKEILINVTDSVKPVGIMPVPYPGQQAALMHEMNVADAIQPKGTGALGQAFSKVTTRTSQGG